MNRIIELLSALIWDLFKIAEGVKKLKDEYRKVAQKVNKTKVEIDESRKKLEEYKVDRDKLRMWQNNSIFNDWID